MCKLKSYFLFLTVITVNVLAVEANHGVIDLRDKRENLHEYWITPDYVAPMYPRRALERGLNGCVGFSFIISNGGQARNIRLTGRFPNNMFVENARIAVEKYRWKPSQHNTEKLAIITDIVIKFEIEGDNIDCSTELDYNYNFHELPEPEICVPKQGSRLLNSCFRERS